MELNLKVDGKNIILILLAGGVGSRLGSETSKKLINIDKITIWEQCIRKFTDKLKTCKILIGKKKKNPR